MEIAITKLSSKGQIVLPKSFRKNLKKGDDLLIMKNKEQWILRKATKMDKQLAEDLEFARRTEEAWKRIERGEGITLDFDDFIEEMKKW